MTNEHKNEPEKLTLMSLDPVIGRRTELLQLFPEARTEGGKIDFDQLKRVLAETVDTGKERYGIIWPGKADCFRTIQASSVATLRPAPNESVNFDTTENLIIEGDNLEVLKILQKSYLNKVKMIYIDPPYNTGNDFIYPDNYAESLQTYLEYSGQVDAEGRKFGTNTEADGRFHSKWLNMMYPRLYLARNLLREDGVILISIDDAELDNLRRILAEIFGEENLIACMVWEKGRKNDAKLISVGHEYLLIYARSLERLKELNTVWREEKPGAREIWEYYVKLREVNGQDDKKIEAQLQAWFSSLPKTHPSRKWSRYRRVDKNGPWRDDNISWPGGDGPRYDVIHPGTGKPCKVPERGWVYSKPETMQLRIAQGIVEFRDDHTEPPYRKSHIRPIANEFDDIENRELDDEFELEPDEELATQVRGSYFYKQSQVSVKYLRKLMGAKLFNNPKDHEELRKLIFYMIGKEANDIVLDFFGGSGTTAESVLQLNQEQRTNHKFIIVQLPEPCNPKEKSGKAALSAGLATVCEVAKERVRRVIRKLNGDGNGKLDLEGLKQQDRGFRVFKLAESNFRVWDAETASDHETLEKQLALHIDHLRADRTTFDVLYEILLKSGFLLTATVEKISLAGKTVFGVAGGALLICLERELTLELIRAMTDKKPERVVCLDEGFAGNDQLKTNSAQTFKTRNIVFRTI